MANDKGSFFSGIKKIIFKDGVSSSQQNTNSANSTEKESHSEQEPVKTYEDQVPTHNISTTVKDDAAKKAYQLIESINQPGVDFFEVWNAIEENGGAHAANLKQAFNTLKYADKTLTKEKLISSGNYYKNELNKALNADIQKKNEEKQAIEDKIKQSKTSLTIEINALETELQKLQKNLEEKKKQLGNLETQWKPKLDEIEQKIQSGKQAIEGVIEKMQALLSLAEKEL